MKPRHITYTTRLTEDYETKINTLKDKMKISISEILKTGIDLLFTHYDKIELINTKNEDSKNKLIGDSIKAAKTKVATK